MVSNQPRWEINVDKTTRAHQDYVNGRIDVITYRSIILEKVDEIYRLTMKRLGVPV